MPATGSVTNPRAATEEAVDAVIAKGVHASIVRLASSVHGDGDHAFVPLLIDIARRTGFRPTLKKAKIAGQPCIVSMPQRCIASHWNEVLRVLAIMPSPRNAFRSRTSPLLSAVG